MMRRIVPAAALLLVALVVRAPMAWACSCIGSDVAKQFQSADVVFVGTPYEPFTVDSSRHTTSIEFNVSDVYKGTVETHPSVETSGSEASCGISFVPGARYTVFATRSARGLSVNLCSGTTTEPGVLDQAGFQPVHPSAAPVAAAHHPRSGLAGPISIVVLVIVLAGAGALALQLRKPGRTGRRAG